MKYRSAKGLGLVPVDMPAGDDGNFYPDRNVTRAKIATMMVRVLDLLKE